MHISKGKLNFHLINVKKIVEAKMANLPLKKEYIKLKYI
jgi:hypothetical protein